MSPAWESWLRTSLNDLADASLLRSLRPISCGSSVSSATQSLEVRESGEGAAACCDCAPSGEFRTFGELGPWDRDAVQVEVSHATFEKWLQDAPSTGEEACNLESVLALASGMSAEQPHKLLLFSANDYLGLSTHPTVRNAAAKAALEFGMGPRASALVCGYTYYHRLLESALADLKKTEECLLCPTGFAANMAVITALASDTRSESNRGSLAFFSDSFNHASIIDGLRVAQRQSKAQVHIYDHADVEHLESLLSSSTSTRKVVITDSLFSMDGDFAPLRELAVLRKKHGFLLVIDEAHGTLVCGENGGGVAEALGVENDVDIHIGTLSKAIGCQGGFIASSREWKQWIQSRGRSFVFSTALPAPVVAAAYAAILIAREERWRQKFLWQRVKQLSGEVGLPFSSPIAPIILKGSEETLSISRQLLRAGFHVSAIRPPTVAANTARLRIALSAAHTAADVTALVAALLPLLKGNAHALSPTISNPKDMTPSIPGFEFHSSQHIGWTVEGTALDVNLRPRL